MIQDQLIFECSNLSTFAFVCFFKFGGKKDTSSGSARAAFRKAKDQNGIPRSKQPSAQYSVPDKHNPNQNLRQYDFVNAYGQKVSIRKDIPVRFFGSSFIIG